MGSSLLMFVPLLALVAGEVDDGAELWACPPRLDCKRFSILERCSRMSLSPASNLIPGSRYMQFALRSLHRRHLGFAPSQRDFLNRHTWHYAASDSLHQAYHSWYYRNSSAPPRIVQRFSIWPLYRPNIVLFVRIEAPITCHLQTCRRE